ncbi:MAG: tRNA preQ1(34) S-adenosylmethionine ribosyltransferase-isomerase QueA [Planctomycetes bacterium]|nr:tRNA preQ1(34) S-adenosylmethionine ribosyltransferase-isomerase QueA [Planctomycetota bacterium]
MKLSDFDYCLPEERIAQNPVEPRDLARLFVHDIEGDESEHRQVRDLEALLRRGDLLVVNDTKVRRARLVGARESGGAVEMLLLELRADLAWRALVRPAAKLREGERIDLEGGQLAAVIGARGPEGGERLVQILDPRTGERASEELLESVGRAPLPPYIRRPRGVDPLSERDRASYQTVFARELGAVAAPTAGLHFTPELLARLDARGVERTSVTLHVGEGTFKGVSVEDVSQHVMHSERYELSRETVAAVERCRARGGRVVAVGTTSVRVLESCAAATGRLVAGSGETRLFLVPGAPFHVVDVLLTNFHLPKSTLLMLVSAFAGRERMLRLYAEALERRYRFFSYGDAMLLVRRAR